MRILTEPKNALVKQYQKLLALDNVELEFEPEALRAIAQEALKRNTGARGLRAIVEELMLDLMYELPGRDDVARVVVTEETVRQRREPIMVTRERAKKQEESA